MEKVDPPPGVFITRLVGLVIFRSLLILVDMMDEMNFLVRIQI